MEAWIFSTERVIFSPPFGINSTQKVIFSTFPRMTLLHRSTASKPPLARNYQSKENQLMRVNSHAGSLCFGTHLGYSQKNALFPKRGNSAPGCVSKQGYCC